MYRTGRGARVAGLAYPRLAPTGMFGLVAVPVRLWVPA
jgi:hypothetical protein